MAGKKRELPRAAVEQLMSAAKEASKKAMGKTATEIFKGYLTLMDKYSDYFSVNHGRKSSISSGQPPSPAKTRILSMQTRTSTWIGF